MIPIPREETSLYYSDHIIDRITLWYMILLLGIDIVYYIFAILFVRMWYEYQPSMIQICKTICIHYIVYSMIVLDLFVYSRSIHYNNNGIDYNIRNIQNSNIITYSILSIVMILCIITITMVTYWKLLYTRQHIIIGGDCPILPIDTFQQSIQQQQQQEQEQQQEEPQPQPQQQPMIIVITGANTGIGKETVRILYNILGSSSSSPSPSPAPSQNSTNTTTTTSTSTTLPIIKAKILLLCRNEQKGQEAIQDIQSTLNNNNNNNHNDQTATKACQLQVVPCDLCSFTSVRTAVQTIQQIATTFDSDKKSSTCMIHTIINNAGVMLSDLSYTNEDHHETCLQANYLGHFLLTSLLLPYLSTSIINVTSSTYHLNTKPLLLPLSMNNKNIVNNNQTCWDENDIQCRKPCKRQYTMFSQYAITKWCNILHTIYISQYYTHIYSAAVHPGLVRTDVVRNMPYYLQLPNTIFGFILQTVQKTPAQGAYNTIHTLAIACNWYNNNRNKDQKNHIPNTDTSSNASESSALLSKAKDKRNTQQTQRQLQNLSSSSNGQYWVNRQPQALHCHPKRLRNPNRILEEAIVLWNWSIQQVQLTESEIQALRNIEQKDITTTTIDTSIDSNKQDKHSKKD